MKSGCTRLEIYKEVRHELEGNGAIKDKPSVQPKKRRLDPESEFRYHVSRAVLKEIYPLISTFFRHSMFPAERLFFDQPGCLLCENASPFIDVNRCFSRGVITEIEITHPLVGSTAAADKDQMNKNLVSKAENSRKEYLFHSSVQSECQEWRKQ
jgi:hypothetical protein